MNWPESIPLIHGGSFRPDSARLVGERGNRFLFLTRGLRRTILVECDAAGWRAQRVWRDDARAFLADARE